MKNSIKSMIFGGAVLFALSMCLTSCEGALDDLFGEWDKPAPEASIAVTSISLDPTLEVAAGKTGQLTATVAPDNATDKTITWSSNNTAAATVDANGLVTAIAVGTATITAKAGDKSATCEVTVTPGLSTPLTLEILTAGTIVIKRPKVGMKYKKNDEAPVSIGSTSDVTISGLNVGDKVEFYGDGTNITAYSSNGDLSQTTQIKDGTADLKVYGNIMSLVDETGFATATTLANEAFYMFFNGNTQLKDASGLIMPATTVGANCCFEMFRGCTNLSKAPKELTATTLGAYCYEFMFIDCSSLTNAPKLPATTLTTQCYHAMFASCTNLTNAYVKAAYINTDTECEDMFDGCAATAVIHTTSANKANWATAISNEGWATWTAQDDWTD
jgi:hypothetical protein